MQKSADPFFNYTKSNNNMNIEYPNITHISNLSKIEEEEEEVKEKYIPTNVMNAHIKNETKDDGKKAQNQEFQSDYHLNLFNSFQAGILRKILLLNIIF